MRFEVTFALAKLGERSPEFFIREALSDPDQTAKMNAMKALQELDRRRATSILKDILRLM